jgi:hypothetical protein
MTGEQTLIGRAAVGVAMAACSLVGWRLAPRITLDRDRFCRRLLLVYALSRLALFALAFLVFHLEPRGDIHEYMDEGNGVLAGKHIYRDYRSVHAPLEPFLMGAMLRIHHSPRTIIFFSILFDVAALWLWMKVGRHFLSETTLKRAGILVLFNPTGLLTVALDGSVNSLVALLLALGVYAELQRRELLASIWVALGSAAVRFLTLMHAPGYFFAARRKVLWASGFVFTLLLVYGGFAVARVPVLFPLTAEKNHRTANNLTYLVELLSGHGLGQRLPRIAHDRPMVLKLLAISLVAELLTIFVFSKSMWDRYLVMTMFPLCFIVAELPWRRVWIYAAWSAVCVYQASFWASISHFAIATETHVLLIHGNRMAIVLACGEVVMVSGSIYLFYVCVRKLLYPGNAEITQAASQ